MCFWPDFHIWRWKGQWRSYRREGYQASDRGSAPPFNICKQWTWDSFRPYLWKPEGYRLVRNLQFYFFRQKTFFEAGLSMIYSLLWTAHKHNRKQKIDPHGHSFAIFLRPFILSKHTCTHTHTWTAEHCRSHCDKHPQTRHPEQIMSS